MLIDTFIKSAVVFILTVATATLIDALARGFNSSKTYRGAR